MVNPISSDHSVLLLFDDDEIDISDGVSMLKWKSIINNGYILHVKIYDPNMSNYITTIYNRYLRKSRRLPMKLTFRIFSRTSDQQTSKRVAYITDAHMYGDRNCFLEFVAIDPPSWYLSDGDSFGGSYKGKVSEVIKSVLQKYAPEISYDVSSTLDNTQNVWNMYRQDPKSFIISLLDWSSSITNKKTNWIVSSIDDKIIIKEQAELKSYDLGEFTINSANSQSDVIRWTKCDNNHLSNIQSSIITGGISAISGLYCDITNPTTNRDVIVHDGNTENKKNVKIGPNQGFARPTDIRSGSTFVRSIPEDSSGSLGLSYQSYISGRARNLFIGMLDTLNRIKLRTYGIYTLDDSTKLGVSTANIIWTDYIDEPWSGNNKWMVYGFEHVFSKDNEWFTHIYLNRKDHNSSSQFV